MIPHLVVVVDHGRYDLMCASGSTNPVPPNPYYRTVLAGWGEPEIIKEYESGSTISVPSNQVAGQLYIRENNKEFYVVENVQVASTNRWSNFGTSGLYIWHIDTTKSNNTQHDMTPERHYYVSIEQADGLFHIERKVNSGDSTDAFRSGHKTEFSYNTTPNSRWWDGSSSELNIVNISAAGTNMTYKYNSDAKVSIKNELASGQKNQVTQGETVRYKVTVKNTGGLDLHNLTLKSNLNPSWQQTITLLEPGDMREYEFTYVVPMIAQNGDLITNTLTLTCNELTAKTSDAYVIVGKLMLPEGFPIPSGFMPSILPGENNINDGLVITDRDGNEFVWVPCTLGTGTTNQPKYQKWTSGYTTTTNDTLPTKVTNEWGENELTQIEKYGGFYVARYEAGIPDNLTTALGTASSVARNVAGVPVSKKDCVPWNYISYTTAKANAESMYSSASVQSGLITGTQWDTICKLIENAGYNVQANSTAWGNYYGAPVTGINSYSSDNGATWGIESNATKSTTARWLLKTGHTNYTKVKNIYDIAGNLGEWTSEISGSIRSIRGSTFTNGTSTTWKADVRETSTLYVPTYTGTAFGYRVVLYITFEELEGTLEYSETSPTNGNITVTLTTNKEIITPQGWTPADNTNTLFTKVYSDNVDEILEIENVEGETANVHIIINNIGEIITIKYVDVENGALINTIEVGCRKIGTIYNYILPEEYINNENKLWSLVDTWNLNRSHTVVEGTNEIIVEYEKVINNLTIKYIDKDDNTLLNTIEITGLQVGIIHNYILPKNYTYNEAVWILADEENLNRSYTLIKGINEIIVEYEKYIFVSLIKELATGQSETVVPGETINYKITVENPGKADLHNVRITDALDVAWEKTIDLIPNPNNKSFEFVYNGNYREFEVPVSGTYNLQVWGAQGGYQNSPEYGGKGGYSSGEVYLEKGTILYIYVGGSGNTGGTTNGFNGGGTRTSKPGGRRSNRHKNRNKLIICKSNSGRWRRIRWFK